MFARSGIAAAQNVVDSAVATSQNSWDPNKLISESMKARSKEKQVAIRAEAAVKQTEQKLRGEKAIVKRDLAIDKAEAEGKRGLRKAGLVAAAGQLAGTALIKTPDPVKPYQSDTSIYDGLLNTYQDQLAEIERMKTNLQTERTAAQTSGTLQQPVGVQNTDTVSKDVSAASAAIPQGAMSKQNIKNLALQAGFTPQQATTVVGIAGGESGYDPSNSTKRSGLYAKTGEDSVGLMQINWGYHKDSGWLQGLGINSREDLLDPVKNMKAAKYLHDGRGNFGDWTVYNEGIYTDYL